MNSTTCMSTISKECINYLIIHFIYTHVKCMRVITETPYTHVHLICIAWRLGQECMAASLFYKRSRYQVPYRYIRWLFGRCHTRNEINVGHCCTAHFCCILTICWCPAYNASLHIVVRNIELHKGTWYTVHEHSSKNLAKYQSYIWKQVLFFWAI